MEQKFQISLVCDQQVSSYWSSLVATPQNLEIKIKLKINIGYAPPPPPPPPPLAAVAALILL